MKMEMKMKTLEDIRIVALFISDDVVSVKVEAVYMIAVGDLYEYVSV